jgi:hypothetical protein
MTTREELLLRLWGCINRHVIPYYVGRVLVRSSRAQAREEIDPHAVCPAASGNDRAQDCQGDETYQ